MTELVTIKDVARRAGVSSATVSMVLNRVSASRISEATAERVRLAAAELGYAPNLLARGLRRRRTDTIAVTTPAGNVWVVGLPARAQVYGRDDVPHVFAGTAWYWLDLGDIM